MGDFFHRRVKREVYAKCKLIVTTDNTQAREIVLGTYYDPVSLFRIEHKSSTPFAKLSISISCVWLSILARIHLTLATEPEENPPARQVGCEAEIVPFPVRLAFE